MEGLGDFDKPAMFQEGNREDAARAFGISVLEKCFYCPNGRGFVTTEEKLENGQMLEKSETCPVCKGSGRVR